jgi:tetratricopeptide (TPR) repeat protein
LNPDSTCWLIVGIVNFKFKDYDSAVEDLSTCVKRDKKNSSAHTYLGLTLSAVGEYKRAEDEHLLGIKYDGSFLDSWAHLSQVYSGILETCVLPYLLYSYQVTYLCTHFHFLGVIAILFKTGTGCSCFSSVVCNDCTYMKRTCKC